MSFRTNKYQRVGAMRERITIQSAVTNESSGQPIRTWVNTYPNQPAQYIPTSGGETINGKQVEAGIRALFILHKRPGLNPEQQVLMGDETYGIAYVHQLGTQPFYVQLHCKNVVRDDAYQQD